MTQAARITILGAGFGALAMPAWNAAARAMGREDGAQALRWWERLADFVA